MRKPPTIAERVRNRRRRLLKGCAITASVVLVLALAGWWVATHYLGAMLSNLVREQAGASINGRLEFDSLDIDLGGSAVMMNAKVFSVDSDDPVITCPRVRVSFDFLTFFGPNRGKRAVVVELSQPWMRVVRDADGGFNLSHLLKQREPESEPIGISVELRQAEIEFTDNCLLSQGYPRYTAAEGRLSDLLTELGYDPLGPADTAPHQETLGLEGTVVYNQERKELSFNATLDRGDRGGLTAKGLGDSEFAEYSVNIAASDIEFATIASYVHSAFPNVKLGQSGSGQTEPAGVPFLSGGVKDAKLNLSKKRDQPVELSLDVDCLESRLLTATLPELTFPRLDLAWHPRQDSATADLRLLLPGLELAGKPKLNLADHSLSGSLDVSAQDIARLAADLGSAEAPLSGSVSATLSLGGTTDAPDLRLELSGGSLAAAGIKLGEPSGVVALAGGKVSLERVRTAGGDVALTASGSYQTGTKTGRFEVAAEALGIQRLIALAREQGASPPELLNDATGQVQLAAVINIQDGTTRGSLRAWSTKLTAAGYTVEELEADGTLSPPNIELESVSGVLSYAEPVDYLGFTTAGPLRAGFRVGGSVSYMADSPLVLALIGSATTKNLQPEQADVSFKVVGPASDPELRFQLKTRHEENPLTLTAAGHYRKGMAPFTARLTWAETDIDLKGDINLPGRQLDAQLTAKQVRLQQFIDDERISGTGSVTATVKGAFDEPEIAGALALPSLQFRLPEKTYRISDAGCGFKLVGKEAASISSGKLTFNGQPFTFAGTLGRERGSITLEAAKFDLFSALAAVPVGEQAKQSKLEISSAGQFKAVISGELADPLAEVSYDSGPGSVEGHKFSSASLRANVTKDGVQVGRLEVVSSQGRAAVTGRVGFSPLTYDGTVEVSSFDVGIITPVIGGAALASLRGNLDGKLAVSGTPEGYSANGSLKLTGGSLKGTPVELAEATVRSTGNRLIVESLHAKSGSGTVDAEGAITFDPLQIEGSMEAHGFNVSLVSGLLDNDLLGSLKGELDAQLGYSGSASVYSASGTVTLRNGSFRGVAIDSAQAKLSAGGGRLNIDSLTLTMQGSTLVAFGSIGSSWADTTLDVRAPSPVDLAVLLPFVPDEVPDLAGKVTLLATVRPTKGDYPSVELEISDGGQGLSAGAAKFSSVDLKLKLDRAALRIIRCDLVANGNSLSIGGEWHLESGSPPLSLWASAKNFRLDDLASLLPPEYAEMVPSGSLDFDRLELGGKLKSPLLTGTVAFDLTGMPSSVPLNIAQATGTVSFVKNDFDIPRTDVVVEHEGMRNTMVLSGSGQFTMLPFALIQGGVTAQLSPGGAPVRVRYSGPFTFDGFISGNIYVRAGRGTERAVITGTVIIGGEDLSSTIWLPGSDESERSETTGAPLLLRDLEVFARPGTTVRYSPIDLRAEANTGEQPLTISGVPGRYSGKNNTPYPDEVKICGAAYLTKGSMFLPQFGRTVRIEGSSNRLWFACKPREVIPYYTGSAAVVLPRVLQGETIETGGGLQTNRAAQRGDLKVILGFNDILLDPGSGSLDKIGLTSDPPRSPQQIRNYLLGGINELQAGRSQITEFAEAQLYTAGTGFISRALETAFNLEAFSFGGTGSEDNPYYVDVEKDVSDKLTFTYYRDFFNQTGQTEEFGLRYNLLEGMYDGNFQNLDLSVNFAEGGFTGPEREFMFEWTTRF